MGIIGSGEKLANKLRECVTKHLHDEKLSTDDLAHYLGMSRSQLHRRVRQLFNCSTTAYIRRIRLENAATLLKEGDLSVSEIAYSTGFGSPSYFSTCFHKAYGTTPVDFMESATVVNPRPWYKRVYAYVRRRNILYLASVLIIMLLGWFVYPGIFGSNDVCIAVLNFRNASDDKNLRVLAEGIPEEIRYKLSKYPDVRVKSSSAVRSAGPFAANVGELGKRLEVTHFVEGRIQFLRGSVTVFVKLINLDDEILWSEKYVSRYQEIEAIEQKICQEVISALPIDGNATEWINGRHVDLHNITAIELHQNGITYLEKFHTAGRQEYLRQARGCFERALMLDSSYARCWVGIGKAYLWMQTNRQDDMYGQLDSVRYFAEKALTIDPYLADAFDLMSRYYRHIGDYDAILNTLRKGVLYNPNDANLCLLLGEYLTISDDSFIEGMEYMKKAAMMEKGGERYASVLRSMGWSFCHIGDYDRSEQHFRLAKEFDPLIYYQNMAIVDFPRGDFIAQVRRTDSLCFENEMDYELCLYRYARSYYYAGIVDSAYHYLSELISYKYGKKWDPEDTTLPWVAGFILCDAGYNAEGMALLNAWIQKIKKDQKHGRNLAFFTGDYELAGIYAFLGDRENAIRYLKAYEHKGFIEGHHSRIATMIYWRQFRNDPEVREIVERVSQQKYQVRQQYYRLESTDRI